MKLKMGVSGDQRASGEQVKQICHVGALATSTPSPRRTSTNAKSANYLHEIIFAMAGLLFKKLRAAQKKPTSALTGN
jgi:hypothetical protein